MARKKTETSVQEIEADKFYKVKFRIPHAIGRMKFSPLHSYRIRGEVLAAIPAEKIASAEQV